MGWARCGFVVLVMGLFVDYCGKSAIQSNFASLLRASSATLITFP